MKKVKNAKCILAIIALSGSISAYAAMGYLKGEQSNGMNKICYYDVLGSTYTLNVPSHQICPVTYNF